MKLENGVYTNPIGKKIVFSWHTFPPGFVLPTTLENTGLLMVAWYGSMVALLKYCVQVPLQNLLFLLSGHDPSSILLSPLLATTITLFSKFFLSCQIFPMSLKVSETNSESVLAINSTHIFQNLSKTKLTGESNQKQPFPPQVGIARGAS